ncbi:maleylpyruvate isomerase N-terminal domain-containing protein [Streptomyces sp. NPDC050743]|uniref:maleylpyruvate isomerase N-terminal domain-containing protein n=1 Tax=Streptomyces sp. NPDC050743 TaxID=3365634 RepID=UPI0037992CD8
MAAFEPLLRTAAPDTPVPTCGSWNLQDLGTHLGQAYRFAATVVRTGRPSREQVTAADGEPVADWYAQGADVLLSALEEADPAAPCWAFGIEEAVTALWFRRVVMDTAVHLVDAQLATGAEVHVEPLIAADGVDEVFDLMVPLVWGRGEPKALPGSVALRTGSAPTPLRVRAARQPTGAHGRCTGHARCPSWSPLSSCIRTYPRALTVESSRSSWAASPPCGVDTGSP